MCRDRAGRGKRGTVASVHAGRLDAHLAELFVAGTGGGPSNAAGRCSRGDGAAGHHRTTGRHSALGVLARPLCAYRDRGPGSIFHVRKSRSDVQPATGCECNHRLLARADSWTV